MPVMIQIRNVPDDVHKKLKARAAAAGMSLSDYLLREATRLAERPSISELIKKMKKMKPIITKESSLESVRAIRGK